jgi:hypothetical protein
MLVIRLTHVSHTRQLSSDNSGQPVALVSTLTGFAVRFQHHSRHFILPLFEHFVPGRRLFQTHAMADEKAGIEFVFVQRLFPI